MWTSKGFGIPNGCASPVTISAPSSPGGVRIPSDTGLLDTTNKDLFS